MGRETEGGGRHQALHDIMGKKHVHVCGSTTPMTHVS